MRRGAAVGGDHPELPRLAPGILRENLLERGRRLDPLLEQREHLRPVAATPAAWVATAPTPAFAHGTTEPTAK